MTAIAVGLLMLAAVPATAATFLVAEDGTDTGDCTVDPCATIQYAIDQHRAAPSPGDAIEIGPGDFTGNVETDDPVDQGLAIRGSVSAGEPQTSLHGEGDGAIVDGTPTGIAVLLGGCGRNGVTLRNVKVDTVGADPFVMAIELERGSDLIGVEATNQPGSTAFSVVGTCGRGSVIRRSTITGTDEDSAVFSSDGLRVIESTLSSTATSTPALFQLPNDLPGTQLRVKRSQIIAPADSPSEAVFGGADLVLDSSLITGGNIGAYTVGAAEINNTTIDPGEPGASPSTPTPSLVLDSFFDPAEVGVQSSILVGELVASPGAEGHAGCEFTDLSSADATPDFEIDCDPGSSGNTSTDPADLFVGGAPYDWSLRPTAPAIDTGGPGAGPPNGFAIRDLAGNPRSAAGSAATCPAGVRDKGAYEFVGPPCELSPPTVIDADDPRPGDRIESTRGTWSNSPTHRTRIWLRCDAAGANCAAIGPPPRSGIGYPVTGRDVGHTIRVQIVASNAAGDSQPAVSAPSGVVTRR